MEGHVAREELARSALSGLLMGVGTTELNGKDFDGSKAVGDKVTFNVRDGLGGNIGFCGVEVFERIAEGTVTSCAVEMGFRDVEKEGLEKTELIRVEWGVVLEVETSCTREGE